MPNTRRSKSDFQGRIGYSPISPQSILDLMESVYPDEIDVKNNGALTDAESSGFDSSAAIQSAIDEAEADFIAGGSADNSLLHDVVLPSGTFNCNSLNWLGRCSLIGSTTGITRLRFNGDGATGSHILDITGANIHISNPRIEHIHFDGWDGVLNSGNVAENLIKNSGNNGWDLNAYIRSCQFQRCWGDALNVGGTTKGFVNFHMERVRWDGVGGWPILVGGNAGMESRPFTISKWTIDNNLSPADYSTTVATMGHFNGTNWGKGLVELIDGRGIQLMFIDGRIEMNTQLIDAVAGVKCFVNVLDPGSGNLGSVLFQHVYGLCKPEDALVMVYDPGANMSYREKFMLIDNIARNYFGSNLEHHFQARGTYVGVTHPTTGLAGLTVDGLKIVKNTSPDGRFEFYRRGDIIINSLPNIPEIFAWQMTEPFVGHAYGTARNFTANASINGTTTVTFDTKADLEWMSEGLNVVVEEPTSGNLTTRVTAVDADAGTITILDTTTDTASGVTVSEVQPTWTSVCLLGTENRLSRTGASAMGTTGTTLWTSTGTGQALTLANGVTLNSSNSHQRITILYIAEGAGADTGVLTPTSLSGGTTITFNDVGDTATLIWDGNNWFMTGGSAIIA